MKKGYLVLNGGEAFSTESREADRAWLKLLRDDHSPRVVVVPAAAMDKHQKIAHETCKYFSGLNTFAEYKLITNQTLANTQVEYETLEKVEAIVLPDGSPIDLIARLKGTHTAKALFGALERKAAVMATGASAMALCGVYWFAGEWEPGLGLAPHLAVLVHHNLVAGRLTPERLLATLPAGITLMGIDQHTTLICHPDDSYQVAGQGVVTVYHSQEDLRVYQDGTRFALT